MYRIFFIQLLLNIQMLDLLKEIKIITMMEILYFWGFFRKSIIHVFKTKFLFNHFFNLKVLAKTIVLRYVSVRSRTPSQTLPFAILCPYTHSANTTNIIDFFRTFRLYEYWKPNLTHTSDFFCFIKILKIVIECYR